jgi:hypothetical protein
MRYATKRGIFWSLAGLVWLAFVIAGSGLLWDYQTTPGAQAAAPPVWPTGGHVELAADRFTLVLLGHPRCPCTRASLGELAELMAGIQGKVDAYVLFVRPASATADWTQTDLWRSAAEIPGVRELVDEKGTEARRLGARTSGEVLLYDPHGRLLFRITRASARSRRSYTAKCPRRHGPLYTVVRCSILILHEFWRRIFSLT